MNINPANVFTNGDNIAISMSFAKFDKERRTVAGFATVDNADKHDDIVTMDASVAAFEKFRGNVREMHQPKAVGKIISFSPESVYDPETGNTYSGVYVEAKVSKGAQDTWEKVLDGTLSGFSIGGRVIDAEVGWSDTLQKNVQIIKQMELYELSLVDNPANPLANFVSIQKFTDTVDFSKSSSETVYACDDCHLAISSHESSKFCPQCSSGMKKIGWVERADAVSQAIKKIADDYYTSESDSEKGPLPETDDKFSEGEINMSEEHVEEPVAEESEVEQQEIVAENTAEESDEGEAVAGAEESESEFDSITARLSDLQATLEEIVNTFAESSKESVAVTKALEERIDGFQSKIEEISDKVEKSLGDISQTVETVEQKVEKVADSTASKKSGELGREPEIKKGLWSGHFLGVDSLDRE